MNYVAVCDGGVEPTNNKLFGDNWTTISHCGRVEWKKYVGNWKYPIGSMVLVYMLT